MIVVVVTDPGALLVADYRLEHNDRGTLERKFTDNSFQLMLIVVVCFYLLNLSRRWANQTCLVPLVLVVVCGD
jgi:hypothetical protein